MKPVAVNFPRVPTWLRPGKLTVAADDPRNWLATMTPAPLIVPVLVVSETVPLVVPPVEIVPGTVMFADASVTPAATSGPATVSVPVGCCSVNVLPPPETVKLPTVSMPEELAVSETGPPLTVPVSVETFRNPPLPPSVTVPVARRSSARATPPLARSKALPVVMPVAVIAPAAWPSRISVEPMPVRLTMLPPVPTFRPPAVFGAYSNTPPVTVPALENLSARNEAALAPGTVTAPPAAILMPLPPPVEVRTASPPVVASVPPIAKAPPLTSVKPLTAVTAPIVPTELPAVVSVTVPALPANVPTLVSAADCVTAPEVRKSSVFTPEALIAPSTEMAVAVVTIDPPTVAPPSRSVSAFMLLIVVCDSAKPPAPPRWIADADAGAISIVPVEELTCEPLAVVRVSACRVASLPAVGTEIEP